MVMPLVVFAFFESYIKKLAPLLATCESFETMNISILLLVTLAALGFALPEPGKKPCLSALDCGKCFHCEDGHCFADPSRC